MKVGTGVSFSYATLSRTEANGVERILSALVNELTLVSPTHRPLEPRAAVLTFHPARTADHTTAGGMGVPASGQTIRRYFETKITVR